MDFGSLIPVVAIVSTAWVTITLLRFIQGRSPASATAAVSTSSLGDARENARLAHENEGLRLTVRRLEERMAVLERLATDPAERTAREIERLR